MSTIRFGISHLPPDDGNDAEFLDEMRKVIKTVEETEGHVWKPYLSDIPID